MIRNLASVVLAATVLTAPVQHQQPTYTPPVVAIAPAPVVQYYAAAYDPTKPVSAEKIREYGERLERLESKIDRLLLAAEAKGDIPPLAKPKDALTVARASCIACHTPGKADAKGGGFVLLADDAGSSLAPLSGNGKTRVREAVESGHMPPSGKLGAEERAAFKW